MAKPLKKFKGATELFVNWIITFPKADEEVLKSNEPYKIIAVSEKLFYVVPFNIIKDMKFRSAAQRNKMYSKHTISVEYPVDCNWYGSHTDNFEKEQAQKEEERSRKEEALDKIRNIEMKEELKIAILDLLKAIEEEIRDEFWKRFDAILEGMKNKKELYGAEWSEKTMSEVSKITLKYMGEQGWSFAFEHKNKLFFTRPKVLKGLK